MSERPERAYDWAIDTEPFYVFLGIYVAGFQWIEVKLEEIILLHAGHERRAETLDRLARMKNYQKVDAVAAASRDAERFPRLAAHPKWDERASRIVDGLNAERNRRNAILHSAYWLRGLEQGLDAIRTNKKRANGTVQFDTEEMTRERMDAILGEMAVLAFNSGQLHLQLVAWAT
jgi:hypothetical protein